MEKGDQKLEQTEVEEQQEEETTLVVRKSRTGNDNKTPETAAAGFEVTDGVSGSNVHIAQSESVEIGAENEERTPAENPNREKLNGVLENESEAINGEHKSENLVFYDDIEGIWKCRLCSWTYCNGSVCVDHIQHHKGQLHKLMNLNLLNFEYKGVESESYFGEKQILKDTKPQKLDISPLDFVILNNSTSAINDRHGREIENNGIFSSNLKPSQISFQEGFTSYDSSKEIESAEVDLIHEDDLEVAEEDVERVIKKQTTHDLYCPNCNSCITRRVVLRKRKRRIRVSDEEVKRNKIETEVDPKLGTSLVQSSSNQVDDNDAQNQIPAADEDERERGPDIFRCLLCFSFFIPTGDGFKLFRIFGEKSTKETVHDEQAPSIKKNWFKSMFTSNKMETAVVEQGSRDAVIPSSKLSGQSGQPSFSQEARTSPQEGGDKNLTFPNQNPSLNGKVAIGVGDKLDTKATETVDATPELFDSYTTDRFSESKSSQVVNGNHERDLSVTTLHTWTQVNNGKPSGDTISISQEGGLKLLISENNGSSTLGNSDEVQLSKQTVQPGSADKEITQLTPASVPVLKASDVDGKLNISVAIPHSEQDVRAPILTESVLENKTANFSSSDSVHIQHTEVSQHMTTKTEIDIHSSEPLKVDSLSALNNAAIIQGKDTVIMIDQQPASSDTTQSTTHPRGTTIISQSATQSNIADSERTETRKEYEIEVVKSIVYGGLGESITSLGVVSSAVGGGAATLNVLALGAANLIGGLLIIFLNLWDLKSDRLEQLSNQIVEQRDRYKELLGQRQNFILHAIVAITSYIIFGLVPPIIYGFSFRKSHDKQLKLVVAGAASLACILVLAILKAYTQRHPKPYLKTVTTYVVLGFLVSGVSYAAGELIERLLDELGLFQTGLVPNLVVPEMRPTGLGWASY